MNIVKCLTLIAMIATVAACKSDKNNPINPQSTVDAQGATFARLFKAPNNSEPSAINMDSAGVITLVAEPMKLM